MFHERKQKQSESVDDYAQELRRLYQKAYTRAQSGNPAAAAMGRSVLAYQFVSGLLPELKSKVAGTDGDFEHQLAKARFEEAKTRELAAVTKPLKESVRTPPCRPRVYRGSTLHPTWTVSVVIVVGCTATTDGIAGTGTPREMVRHVGLHLLRRTQ